MKLSEIADEIIAMAQSANRARDAVEPDEDSPTTSGVGSPQVALVAEEKRLHDYFLRLPAAVVYLLTAIMYLGRGDFDTKEELLDCYAQVSETLNPELAANRMIQREALSEYLEDGFKKLAKIGFDGDEFLKGKE